MNKTQVVKLSGAIAGVLIFGTSNATIIIDYDDGLVNGVHDAAVNDGGFESFVVQDNSKFNQDSSTGNFLAGFDTAINSGWLNLANNEDRTAAHQAFSRTGSMSAFPLSGVDQLWGLATGYTIQSGDSFAGSFWYRLTGTGSTATDVVTITLFTVFDDTLNNASTLANEVVTNLYTYTMPGTATSEYQQFSFTSGIVAESAVNKQLMFSISKSGFDGTSEFARFDDIYLTTVPEPATFALLAGFATLGLVMYRRRKTQF